MPAMSSLKKKLNDKQGKIFISFRVKHKETVTQIKDDIEKHLGQGACWVCTTKVLVGDNLDTKIVMAIDEASLVLCIINDDYADSIECEKEVLLARQTKKPIIPILIDKVDWPLKMSNGKPSPMRLAFAQLKYINLAAENREEAFEELIQKITQIIQADEEPIDKQKDTTDSGTINNDETRGRKRKNNIEDEESNPSHSTRGPQASTGINITGDNNHVMCNNSITYNR